MQLPEIDPRQVAVTDHLLDVREDDEWAAGHAPEAVHLPLHQLPLHLDGLPREGRVAVICRVGSRSAQATAYLIGQVFDAANVEGGMFGWQACGLPVVTDDGRPGRVL